MRIRIFFTLFFIVIFCILLSALFLFKKTRNENEIKTNKVFILEKSNNNKKGQNKKLFLARNSLETLEKINGQIPSFIVTAYGINTKTQRDDIEKILMVSNKINFGFEAIDNELFRGIKNLGGHILIRIIFDTGVSDKDSFKNYPDQIVINPNYSKEENFEILNKIRNLIGQFNVGFYVTEENIDKINVNDEVISIFTEYKPIYIKQHEICDIENHICYFDKNFDTNKMIEYSKTMIDENGLNNHWNLIIESRFNLIDTIINLKRKLDDGKLIKTK